MENWTPAMILAALLGLAGAIKLISDAIEGIIKTVKFAKAPNDAQNKRLDALENRMDEVDRRLKADHGHLTKIDEGERVTQRALIALLDHGIDGNNIEQMQHAKEELQDHLINR
jgi:hypothetical protein